jgi:anti-sigma-K factor RskA
VTDDPHALTGAYAVDALSPDERTAFEAHLRGCAECAEEVLSLQATAARLGATAAAAPPPSLRADVLGRIRTVRQLPPDRAGADVLPSVPEAAEPSQAGWPGGAGLPAILRWWQRRWEPWQAGLAAAACLATVAAVTLGVVAVRQDHRADRAVAAQAALVRVLAAPDVRVAAGPVGTVGRARVLVSDTLDEGVLVVDGLPDAPAGRSYQAWYVAGGTARSAGLVPLAASGPTTRELDGDPGNATTVALTIEPAGGSDQPTTKPIVALSLPGS